MFHWSQGAMEESYAWWISGQELDKNVSNMSRNKNALKNTNGQSSGLVLCECVRTYIQPERKTFLD